MAQKTVTANGNAQIDTAQSKFGGASGLFDGTGDYLTTPADGDWSFSTATDFTIDLWIRIVDTTRDAQRLCTVGAAGTNTLTTMFRYRDVGGGDFQRQINFGGAVNDAFWNVAAVNNTWHHVAVVRSGSTITGYFDGTSVGTATNESLGDATGTLYIGQNSGAGANNFDGWMDEYRISKGVARWTTNFTPPTTEYTADAQTVLLLHMNGTDGSTTFTDDSTSIALTNHFLLTGI